MKEKNIQELAIRMGLISVDDMCQYTISQLVIMVANKVNELVGEVWRFETDVQETLKSQNENIQYLLGEGLHIEVGNIFDGWVKDGTFDTLLNQSALKKVNNRIDETNAQLSHKANRLEVYLKENRININDFDDETRRAILEAHGINVNYVLGDENVNPQNTTFFDIVVGKNKFNKNNCVFGYYIDYTSGVVRENAGYCYAKHEKIKGGTLYTMNIQSVQTCFYDSNKEYISGHLSSANSMSFTVPSNAKYFTSSVPIDLINQFMIVEGDDLGSYEPYTRTELIKSVHIKQEPITTERLIDNSVTEDKVKDKAINPKKTTFFDIVVGKNKFNKDTVTNGYYLDYTSGTVNMNDGYCYSDFEDINNNTLYTMNLEAIQTCFYNSNKEYVGGHLSTRESKSFTTPSNASYMRLSVPKDVVNQFMIVEGTTIDGYEPYKKAERIPVKYLPQGLEVIGELIIVDKNGSGNFTTLTDAVKYAKNNDVIIVMPGVYENEIVRAWEKTLMIIGIDKNTTIIKNSTGDYRKPPLEMTSGLLKNLTIVAEKNPNGFEGTPAYAIHIENNFMENKTLEIDNCHIVSHVNFAIGCGLRKGCMLEIHNSRLESFSELQGGLYVHDTDVDSMVGLQKLRVKNTEILSNSSNNSAQQLVLQSMHKDGAEFNVEFINTNIRNMTTGNQNYAFQDASDWKTYDRPELVPNISLSKASYGNSLNKLNYDF